MRSQGSEHLPALIGVDLCCIRLSHPGKGSRVRCHVACVGVDKAGPPGLHPREHSILIIWMGGWGPHFLCSETFEKLAPRMLSLRALASPGIWEGNTVFSLLLVPGL